ncbi:MAG: hypothetical protein M1820_008357 [Bogoriella megaspora]|nr:MAG: hypothetical protein M1820_008357 [Bogoriella megaspora]
MAGGASSQSIVRAPVQPAGITFAPSATSVVQQTSTRTPTLSATVASGPVVGGPGVFFGAPPDKERENPDEYGQVSKAPEEWYKDLSLSPSPEPQGSKPPPKKQKKTEREPSKSREGTPWSSSSSSSSQSQRSRQ